MESLQAYPVAGTQLSIAALLMVPVGAIVLHDGISGLRTRAATRVAPAALLFAAVVLALANAAIIAVYTLVDGSGARAAGKAGSYAVWLTFLEAVPFLCWIRMRRGQDAVTYITRQSEGR